MDLVREDTRCGVTFKGKIMKKRKAPKKRTPPRKANGEFRKRKKAK